VSAAVAVATTGTTFRYRIEGWTEDCRSEVAKALQDYRSPLCFEIIEALADIPRILKHTRVPGQQMILLLPRPLLTVIEGPEARMIAEQCGGKSTDLYFAREVPGEQASPPLAPAPLNLVRVLTDEQVSALCKRYAAPFMVGSTTSLDVTVSIAGSEYAVNLSISPQYVGECLFGGLAVAEIHYRVLVTPPAGFPLDNAELWEPLAGGLAQAFYDATHAPAPVKVPSAFDRNGMGTIPNNPALAAYLQGIYQGGPLARFKIGGWAPDDVSGVPLFRHEGRSKAGRRGAIILYVQPDGGPGKPLPGAADLWRHVEALDPFTADVMLACLAQMCEPSTGQRAKAPLLEPVIITPEAVMAYKSIARRGDEKWRLYEKVCAAMERIKSLRFNAIDYHVPTGTSYEWKSWEDTLLDIATIKHHQGDLLSKEEKLISIKWSVRAGLWAYHWLNPEARVWVSRMAKCLIEFDHRANRPAEVLAKKIGERFLTLADSRGRARKNERLELPLSTILEDVGELPIPKARSLRWAGKLRTHIETAIRLLNDSHFGKSIAQLSWSRGFGPEDDDRSRGWVSRWLGGAWLECMFCEELEAEVKQLPAPAPQPKSRHRKQRRPKERTFDWSVIRAERHQMPPWTQTALAKHWGISVPYLCQIESGKRTPSPELAQKIKAWMGERERNAFLP
jgi:DNA-binding XRE family transcriptional regulator